MKSEFTLIFIVIVAGGFLYFLPLDNEKKVVLFTTEGFIQKWLTNDNGTLATYMKEDSSEDSDLVKGRESLSESIGLWMEYSLQKEDQASFDDSYHILKQYFVEEDGFVNWKVTETGQSEVFANALVDDLRISLALFQASEKWDESSYEETAILISQYLSKLNLYNNTLTDYYVKKDDFPSEVITLSYIEPDSLEQLNNRGLLDINIYKNMLTILNEAPMDGSFYPKSYNSKNEQYLYDKKINLIDQSLVALYRAKSGFATEQFLAFIKKEFEKQGVLFGRYDRLTEKPIVKYESPAIYGWLILYSLEVGEEELAQNLFQRMIQFRSDHSLYNGGYSIYQENTHIFDNLVPLMAERKLKDLGLISDK